MGRKFITHYMKPYNWNKFIKRITIDAPAQTIYNAWATQEGLEKWFLQKAEFTTSGNQLRARNEPVQAGDSYEWAWFGYPDTTTERNQVLAVNGYDYLQFSFSGNCIVAVTIKTEQNETICELEQIMTPPDEQEKQFFYIECGKGWTFYMTNLKSILEGGIDLRNKTVEIQNVINA
jgi:uncharacterized protein YndB with AHSA1/START domain